MAKYIFFILILIIFSILILFVGVGQQTNRPFDYFPRLVYQLLTTSESSPPNIMILGLDKRDDWLEKTNTTDTIILSNFQAGKVNLVSLPRDLWDWQLNAKINQIYPLSIDRTDNYQYIQDNFQQVTGQTINKTIIVTTDNLVKLCQLIGGIDVYNEIAVKDEQYPNPEYINHPHSQAPIYITVEYPSGWIHLDATNITPFIRSRHGAETVDAGGTDLGRIKRQQSVFDALFKKLLDSKLINNLPYLFSLYRFWHSDVQTNLTDFYLGLILKSQFSYLNKIQINKINITNLIYHPATFINQQWVFIPQQKDYSSLQQFIQQSLYGSN
ncbi:MAG: LCP family protein [Candidatus Shapirobacteria bacterium]|nr:LCP family protein [Candidatus Shapirobacteria bacterium]